MQSNLSVHTPIDKGWLWKKEFTKNILLNNIFKKSVYLKNIVIVNKILVVEYLKYYYFIFYILEVKFSLYCLKWRIYGLTLYK